MAGSKPEIGAKIVLDGAEEYQRSLKEVANAQKDLNKEMKLAESEFKKTGDAQQLYNEKVRLLNAQMDNQKKKLETAQKALKELSDKGVDKNSDLWRKWNGILLDSQTKMNNLQAELNSTTAAMKDTADATEQVTSATERATQETADYSETLKSIDKGVKFSNILNGWRAVKDAAIGVISTIYRTSKALFMSQVSGGDWAREIMMGAAAADLSVEEYQARLYAQALSGIEYNAIDEGILELGKRLGSTGEDAVTLHTELNKLGIVSRETELQARNAEKTFWEVVDALNAIEDADSRNAAALRIFGDPYKNLRALFEYGGSEYLKLVKEGKAAATLTEESVNALADMDAAFERVSATAKKTGRNVQAELAPGFTALAEAFADTLEEFNAFLDSSEGKAKVDEWNKAVSNFADVIKEADLKSGLDYVEGKLTKIADALNTIHDTWQALKDSRNFYETLFKEGPQAAIKGMIKSETGKNIDAETTFVDYLWKKQQKDLEELMKRHAPTSGTVEKLSENPLAEQQHEQTQQVKSAKEATEELMQMVKELKIAGAFKLREALEQSLANPAYAAAFESEGLTASWQSVIDRINSSEIRTAPESLAAVHELMEALKTAMDVLPQSAQSGGGSATKAFNAAIEKGTKDTKGTLQSGVTAAFSGFDSLFASMGAAHGTAYINALSAQMARINNMLLMQPSYAYGGTFYNPSQSAYASPTSTANVSLYVGREKFGQVATPIVDARMGADLMTIR